MSTLDPDALLDEARTAAAARAHESDPDVIAWRVDRSRIVIERTMWAGIVVGMVFTTVNVQQWTSQLAGAGVWSMSWLAWFLLAPLIEVPLLAILRGEQVTARYGVPVDPRVRTIRRWLIAGTFLLNTWPHLGALIGDWGWSALLVHSAAPLAVLGAAEALTGIRAMLTAATRAAGAIPAGRSSRHRRRPPDRDEDRSDQHADRDQREDQDESAGAPLKVRPAGVAWALEHWADDLAPRHIRAGVLQVHGLNMSRGEASKCLADARVHRGDAPDPRADVEDDTEGTG